MICYIKGIGYGKREMTMKRNTNHRGFTIVELVIVIAVIAILAAVLIPVFSNVIQKAEDSSALQEAKNAYTQYRIASLNENDSALYCVYDAGNGRFVALDNGNPVGIYASLEAALHAMVADADPGKLVAKGQLFVYHAATTVSPNTFAGKKVSILGDSISTYANISNNAAYNSTLTGGAIFYSVGRYGVYQQDTWWQQVIDAWDMELCVNNSWSGSAVLNTRTGTVGVYIDRCVQLHNNAGEMPEVIFVYLGTNDFTDLNSNAAKMGSFEAIRYDELIKKTSDTYHYATPTTVCEAYAIMLHKMTVRYPDAEIYCLSLLARKSGAQPQAFNADLAQIMERAGCKTVDLYSLLTAANFDNYMGDTLHPNPDGMDLISRAVIEAMSNNQTTAYDVDWSLEGVATDSKTQMLIGGNPFAAQLTAEDGYEITSVCVTMGDKDITDSCYSDGQIRINRVTGNLKIVAKAGLKPEKPKNFRWEMKDGQFVSVDTDGYTANPLNMIQGTITDGKFSKVKCVLNEAVVLSHAQPWIMEWKSSGTWTDTTDGALLFAGADSSSTANTPYLYRRHNSDFIAFGVTKNGQYYNYGVKLAGNGIDGTAEHVYRLQNKVNADGSNMVYLFVDGVEIGPMNHHWTGGTDKKTTVDWVNGQDFIFTRMGTSPHTIGNCYIEYIMVSEDGTAG